MADVADIEAPAVDEPAAAEPVLLRSEAQGVVGLTLNRPGQYNALSRELLRQLQAELDRIKDDPSVRVVVIAAPMKPAAAMPISIDEACAAISVSQRTYEKQLVVGTLKMGS